jgi:hypothetical protein
VLATLSWEKQAAANTYQTPETAAWILKIAQSAGHQGGEQTSVVCCSDYFSFSYSAWAAFKIGTAGSASFQRAKKSW